jgi:hypothetical protein
VTDVEIAATTTIGGRGVVAGNTVIAPETETGTATGKGVESEMVKGPTAAVEDTAVIVSEIGTVKTVTKTGDANVTRRILRVKNLPRGGNPTRMSATKMADRVLALPTEEVGLLSIHETNSMIHPDIEEIGITVVERAGALLGKTMNTGNTVTEHKALHPLLSV